MNAGQGLQAFIEVENVLQLRCLAGFRHTLDQGESRDWSLIPLARSITGWTARALDAETGTIISISRGTALQECHGGGDNLVNHARVGPVFELEKKLPDFGPYCLELHVAKFILTDWNAAERVQIERKTLPPLS